MRFLRFYFQPVRSEREVAGSELAWGVILRILVTETAVVESGEFVVSVESLRVESGEKGGLKAESGKQKAMRSALIAWIPTPSWDAVYNLIPSPLWARRFTSRRQGTVTLVVAQNVVIIYNVLKITTRVTTPN